MTKRSYNRFTVKLQRDSILAVIIECNPFGELTIWGPSENDGSILLRFVDRQSVRFWIVNRDGRRIQPLPTTLSDRAREYGLYKTGYLWAAYGKDETVDQND